MFEQIAALKEGRIDVGFGRIPLDDPAVDRQLLRNEKLIAAVPMNHAVLDRKGPLQSCGSRRPAAYRLSQGAAAELCGPGVVAVRDAGLKPPFVHEVRELQTALGLVAADEGICLVPASIETLRRDNVVYRKFDAVHAVSPIIMSSRKGDRSPEIALVLKLIRQMYRREKIVFGA